MSICISNQDNTALLSVTKPGPWSEGDNHAVSCHVLGYIKGINIKIVDASTNLKHAGLNHLEYTEPNPG